MCVITVMTDQELIAKLQGLRQIKPNTDWVALTKTQILGAQLMSFSSLFFQKKFVYAFSVLLLLFVGAFGLVEYTNQPLQPAAILGETSIKNSVAAFKITSQNKTASAKELQDVVKVLTDAITKDPRMAKEVALELKGDKALAMIEGGADVRQTSDTLYKIIDEQIIKDLKNTTLTQDQIIAFEIGQKLFDKGEYVMALEIFLKINE